MVEEVLRTRRATCGKPIGISPADPSPAESTSLPVSAPQRAVQMRDTESFVPLGIPTG